MYLKRLTIKGFKSFADATTLELEPGVTVVVGPNGSGKSNVVDAVTWVLGAQGPRALRSSKMEDVIFAGTASRPALGRAEVSLTIDNADNRLGVDLAEVTITRTLFRSGDSEYSMNGAPCRLLDIQEMLSDSGVGRSQHVIVGQGQLETVLNARPEDRRAIIEEAAGVLKHRRRKERAERRLVATQENLERLGDLLREVRRQMRPLERQAAAARAYSTLAEERLELRLHLAGVELAALQARSDELEQGLREGRTTEQNLRQTLAELDQATTATAAALSQDQAEDLARSVAHVQGLVERARGLRAVLEQRGRGVIQALDASQDENVVASLDADSARLAQEVAAVDRELAELDPDRARLAQAQESLRRAEEEFAATWGDDGDVDALESAAMARERIELLARATSVREGQLNDLLLRQEKNESRSNEQRVQRSDLDQQLEAQRGSIEQLDAALENVRRVLAEAQARLASVEDEATRAEEASARAAARAEALARALDELTGSAGRQSLRDVQGVVGSFIDLLEIDPGWERAVDAAAGAAVAAVVVDGKASAKEALERLQRDGTSALLLAAEATEGVDLGGLPSGVERVEDHVRVRAGQAASVANVVHRVFGRAVRAASLDAAVDVALDRPDLVVVTAQGDRFAESGWRVSSSDNLVSTHTVQEANSLAASAAELARATAGARAQARSEVAQLIESAGEAQRRFDRAVHEVETLGQRRDALDEALVRLGAELEELVEQRSVLDDQLNGEREALTELRAALPALEEAARSAEQRANWAQEARETLEAHRAQVQELRQQTEVKTAELTERRRTLVERVDEVERRLSSHVEARQHAQARRQRLERDGTAIERLTGVVVETTERLETLLELRRQAYSDEISNVRASSERLETLRKERAEADASLHAHLMTVRDFEIERAEVAVKLESTVEFIRRELNADPAAAVAQAQPNLPENVSALERAAALDAELESLGPINPLALEELSSLEERHQDLDKQVTDVREARRELHEVVRALDEEIMMTFASAVADVNENFSNLVAVLFPGGQGRLILTEPDDLLATGVEIEVKPAGKNVRRVSLLSGGEQSLAALAYLFAVFRARPSPFYLMDEVEAALDDVNLHRFLGLIREFRHEAQLIIVSHQKRTMETGDALYGVTMKPGGSSQVVSQRVPHRDEADEEVKVDAP
jgi:chromosome segregation protein